jgi:RNA-binding protein 25
VGPDGERYTHTVPPHLHDLQEAELPEAQRGLVISEIAMFRERAAVREREKSREMSRNMGNMNMPERSGSGGGGQGGYGPGSGAGMQGQNGRPQREWGRPQGDSRGAVGGGPQGYDRAPGFVKSENGANAGAGASGSNSAAAQKTDEQLEEDRKDQRRRDEESSFRDVSQIFIFKGLGHCPFTCSRYHSCICLGS